MSLLKSHTPIKIKVPNHLTSEIYVIESLDESYLLSRQDVKDIVSIANEDLVYHYLHANKLKGKAFNQLEALKFINQAWKGWLRDRKYIFVIKNSSGHIVGSIRIKTNNLDEAEIGYWLSKNASGVMTNTILAIIDLAKRSGFKSLSAYIRPDNTKSISAIKRAGFQEDGSTIRSNRKLIRYIYHMDRNPSFISFESVATAEITA